MKKANVLLLAMSILALNSCMQTEDPVKSEVAPSETVEMDYFQLKIYNFENDQQEALLDAYLGDALLPALHRTGIHNVGVFKPIVGLNERENFLMVVTPFSSLKQFEQVPEFFLDDAEYQQSATAYLDAPHDAPPFAPSVQAQN